jgi:hypothetical protein
MSADTITLLFLERVSLCVLWERTSVASRTQIVMEDEHIPLKQFAMCTARENVLPPLVWEINVMIIMASVATTDLWFAHPLAIPPSPDRNAPLPSEFVSCLIRKTLGISVVTVFNVLRMHHALPLERVKEHARSGAV